MINTIQKLELKAKNPDLVWRFLDALFPPFCCSCGVLGFELCPDCINKIVLVDQRQICPICGDLSQKAKICQNCQRSRPNFDQLLSWGEYSGVLRTAIKKLKFDHGLGLARILSEPSIKHIKSWGIKIDHIVPVPLSNSRQKERGYNQSALLASLISKGLHTRFIMHSLTRVKETRSQVGLNSKERVSNVFDAFRTNDTDNNNKSVLLIDDIATTGSTLNECAKALKIAGAREVFCFTVAKTPLPKLQLEGLEDK